MVAPVDRSKTGLGCTHQPALAKWKGLLPGVSRRSGATTLCKELNIADLRIVVRSRKQQFCEVNIAKGTTDPKVEFSLPKFKQVQTQILIKFHL